MKTLIATSILLIVLGVAFLPYLVQASGNHHGQDVANTTTVTSEVTINHYSTHNTAQNSSGVAVGLAASSKSFYYGTLDLQGAIGVGVYDDQEAISFGLAKRVGKSLVSGSITKDHESMGYSAGIMFIF